MNDVLARLMETQIYCLLVSVRLVEGVLNKGTMAPASSFVWENAVLAFAQSQTIPFFPVCLGVF